MSPHWQASPQAPLYEVKAGLFRGLSHPLRIRVLELLADGQEHTVAELLEQTELEASHLSQHLAVLRHNRLVISERRGSHVHYRLFSPAVADLLSVARRLLTELVDDVESLPKLPTP
ncbi:ArsR/SmtB family transcription factor [Propionibacteriaceae bacterium Y1923]|uniref:ArsR/SmtB family transcription factor n=1 Tax=Aestuariimicrobium sp. Y1814 TaxID=3418742 RepID=UPI003C28BD93